MVAAVPHFRSSQLSQNAKFSPWKHRSRKKLACNSRLKTFKLFKDQRCVCHTAEFLLQKEPEVVPSPRVREQLPEAERPPLHPHLCWRFHTVPTTSEALTGGLNPSGKSAGSLGHVEGPVCDVISQPGVAGETAGQEGVVAAVGGAVLHDPGRHKRPASARLERHIYLKCASAPRDCVHGGEEMRPGQGQACTSWLHAVHID